MFGSLFSLRESRQGQASRHSGRLVHNRLVLESLEDRCLLSSYSITVIGTISSSFSDVNFSINSINNASIVQVAGRTNPSGVTTALGDHAFLWDNLHGMKDLGALGTDNASAATGVNDSGEVVGQSWKVTWVPPKKNHSFGNGYWSVSSQNAFSWTSAKGMQDLGSNVEATGINDSGEISAENNGAALWNGRWHALGSLGGSNSRANGINNYGQVVGDAAIASGALHPFLWTPSTPGGTTGSMVDLSTFGGQTGSASAVNSQGYVIGSSSTAVGAGAVVWRPSTPNGTHGTMIMLDPADGGIAKGINGNAFVVGADDFGTGDLRAALWTPGTNGSYTMSDLNSLIPTGTGWSLFSAEAINDSGQIVVQAFNGQGTYDLLLTPSATTTPLAHSVAAMLISAGSGVRPFTTGPSVPPTQLTFNDPASVPSMQTTSAISKEIASANSLSPTPKQTAAVLDQVFTNLGALDLVDLSVGLV